MNAPGRRIIWKEKILFLNFNRIWPVLMNTGEVHHQWLKPDSTLFLERSVMRETALLFSSKFQGGHSRNLNLLTNLNLSHEQIPSGHLQR